LREQLDALLSFFRKRPWIEMALNVTVGSLVQPQPETELPDEHELDRGGSNSKTENRSAYGVTRSFHDIDES